MIDCQNTMRFARIVLVLGMYLVAAFAVSAADTLRVCTYNVLNYGTSNDDGRIPMYATIMQEIKPDILVCQEVVDNSLGPQFISNVLTWSSFGASPFVDGRDTDNQLFYDLRKLRLLTHRQIGTELRNISEYMLERFPVAGQQPDTLVVYSGHLKANNDDASAAQRGREVAAMQATASSAPYLFFCGDLNVYSPNETAYRALTQPAMGRTFVDPLGTSWVRNTSQHAALYTQCTRANTISGCGGGVDGGLDDRFDFILCSPQLVSRIVPGSYSAFGNDGVPRLNSSINNPTNQRVSSTIADALLCASDHLPVYADVILGDVPAHVHDEERQGALLRAHFDGSTLTVSNCTPNQPLEIYNATGQLLHSTLVVGTEMSVQLPNLTSGIYFVKHHAHVAVFIY